jgi:lipoate-protein ligase A
LYLLWEVTIEQLFSQILTRDETLREKAVNFLRDKIVPLKSELIVGKEPVEQSLAENIKKAMADVNGDEFKLFMDLLSSLKMYQGKDTSELLDIIATQADLQSDFQVLNCKRYFANY